MRTLVEKVLFRPFSFDANGSEVEGPATAEPERAYTLSEISDAIGWSSMFIPGMDRALTLRLIAETRMRLEVRRS